MYTTLTVLIFVDCGRWVAVFRHNRVPTSSRQNTDRLLSRNLGHVHHNKCCKSRKTAVRHLTGVTGLNLRPATNTLVASHRPAWSRKYEHQRAGLVLRSSRTTSWGPHENRTLFLSYKPSSTHSLCFIYGRAIVTTKVDIKKRLLFRVTDRKTGSAARTTQDLAVAQGLI